MNMPNYFFLNIFTLFKKDFPIIAFIFSKLTKSKLITTKQI